MLSEGFTEVNSLVSESVGLLLAKAITKFFA